MEIKSWLETTGMGEFQNGCDLSSYKILKLTAISQEGINWLNWFFAYWQKFRKTKSDSIINWRGVVKHGHDFLGQGTLKSAISQEWYEFSKFFACWCKFRKAENDFNKYWVEVVKYGYDFLSHVTQKFAVSQE